MLWCLLAGHGSAGLTGRAVLFVLSRCWSLIDTRRPSAPAAGRRTDRTDWSGLCSSAISLLPFARKGGGHALVVPRGGGPQFPRRARRFWSASATCSTRRVCPSTGSVTEDHDGGLTSASASTSTRMNRERRRARYDATGAEKGRALVPPPVRSTCGSTQAERVVELLVLNVSVPAAA